MRTKQISLVLIAIVVLLSTCEKVFAEQHYGVLKVISNHNIGKIYIDGELEGAGNISRDKIIVGNHLVQVKDDDMKVVFEEMVLVREGEQTTVFAKIGGVVTSEVKTPQKSDEHLSSSSIISNYGVNATYGSWTANVNVLGNSISTQSSEPVKEIGIYVKGTLDNNTYFKCSYDYVLPLSDGSINGSFVGMDFGSQNEYIDGSVGINYSFPAMSGFSSLTGALGYQATLGVKLTRFTIGTKYLILNGSGDFTYGSNTYKVNASYSQLLFYVSADFNPYSKQTTTIQNI
jgi:hypothetical protein